MSAAITPRARAAWSDCDAFYRRSGSHPVVLRVHPSARVRASSQVELLASQRRAHARSRARVVPHEGNCLSQRPRDVRTHERSSPCKASSAASLAVAPRVRHVRGGRLASACVLDEIEPGCEHPTYQSTSAPRASAPLRPRPGHPLRCKPSTPFDEGDFARWSAPPRHRHHPRPPGRRHHRPQDRPPGALRRSRSLLRRLTCSHDARLSGRFGLFARAKWT